MQHNITALVPMKGHSERVPNKNLRLFCGQSLYHYIVTNLLKCSCVSQVVINTDSNAVASDVQSSFPERVSVLVRPSSICGDFVSMNTIIEYDLSQIEGEYFLQTHSTNPLLKTETITRAVQIFLDQNCYDSLFGVNRFQSRFYDHTGKSLNHNPEEMLRTQDLPPVYEENSNLYLFTRQSFQKTGRRIGSHPMMYEIPRLEGIDIDVEEDFRLAELLYENVFKTKNQK